MELQSLVNSSGFENSLISDGTVSVLAVLEIRLFKHRKNNLIPWRLCLGCFGGATIINLEPVVTTTAARTVSDTNNGTANFAASC